MPRSPREAALKRRIREWLKPFAARGEAVFWPSPPSSFGESGLADYMGVWRGWAVAIEVKREDGSYALTANQVDFLRRFHKAGGRVIVAHTLEDVTTVLGLLGWRGAEPAQE